MQKNASCGVIGIEFNSSDGTVTDLCIWKDLCDGTPEPTHYNLSNHETSKEEALNWDTAEGHLSIATPPNDVKRSD